MVDERKPPLVLVCGDRLWHEVEPIRRRLSFLPPDTVILTGGANGADKIAEQVAEQQGLKVRVFEADWRKHGPAGGPLRNIAMLNEKPDLVIAFHHDLSRSRGTAHCVATARRRKIPTEVYG